MTKPVTAPGLYPLVAILTAFLMVGAGVSAQRPSPTPDLEGFRAWLDLARRHEPGKLDAAVEGQRALTVEAHLGFESDLEALIQFIQNPNLRRLQWSTREYKAAEQAQLQLMAARELKAGTSDALLRQVALLQSDSVMLPGGLMFVVVPPGSSARPDMTLTRDGMSLGGVMSPPNWRIARTAIGGISAGPSRLEWARRWYEVTTAFLFWRNQFAILPAHLARRRVMLPNDAGVAFDEGCLLEAFAYDRVQRVAAEDRLAGMISAVPDRRTSLERARRLFEQAVERDGRHVEARLRLARVKWALGETRQAAKELDALVPRLVNDRELSYFAQLFLGAAYESNGDEARAVAAFTEASRLYPNALSPLLSKLGLASGPGGPDVDTLTRLLRRDQRRPDDPWFDYQAGPGRQALALATEFWRMAAGG